MKFPPQKFAAETFFHITENFPAIYNEGMTY